MNLDQLKTAFDSGGLTSAIVTPIEFLKALMLLLQVHQKLDLKRLRCNSKWHHLLRSGPKAITNFISWTFMVY